MQLSRKQVILISIISGVVLLLTLAVVLFLTPEEGAMEPATTSSPLPTALPATPTPTISPSPTAFRLPLVPQWDTPRPTAEPSGAIGAFVPKLSEPPDTGATQGTAGPWVGAWDEHTKDMLAVGLQDGRAAALLLMRLTGGTLTILALPVESMGAGGLSIQRTPLVGEELATQGAQAAAMAERETGMGFPAWLALDLACLPAVLEVTGPLGDSGTDVSTPEGALTLMTEAAAYMERVSLLKLPALKRAVGDGFGSNLSTRDLWSLFWTVRSGVSVRGLLLPMVKTEEGPRADFSLLQKYFGESS